MALWRLFETFSLNAFQTGSFAERPILELEQPDTLSGPPAGLFLTAQVLTHPWQRLGNHNGWSVSRPTKIIIAHLFPFANKKVMQTIIDEPLTKMQQS